MNNQLKGSFRTKTDNASRKMLGRKYYWYHFHYQYMYLSNYLATTLVVCVMVSMLTSSAVDRGFEHRLGQTKDYKIGICCFSAKHAALRRKIKDWLARNQDNVSEWGDMSIRGLLFQ